jgi:hypothetical protein
MRTVNFYRLPNGKSPVEKFLDSLTGKQAQKVLWVLQLIEELESVPRQYFKKLADSEEIWKSVFNSEMIFSDCLGSLIAAHCSF